jgi:hypothetical protein
MSDNDLGIVIIEHNDPLAMALEGVATTGLRRGHVDVYRYAMAATGLLLADAVRNRPTAEVVFDTCTAWLAKNGNRS